MEIKSFVLSSLAKIMPCASEKDFFQPEEFTCLKGEKLRFQLALLSDTKTDVSIKVSCPEEYKVFTVEYEPVLLAADPNADDNYISHLPGLYPDILMPLRINSLRLLPGQFTTLYFEVRSDIPGERKIDVDVCSEEGEVILCKSVKAFTFAAEMPKSDTVCTHWFHTDCLCDEYRLEPFSEDYWRCVKNYMTAAAEHSINSLLVPLFTPALDTEVGKERKTIQLVDVKVTPGGYEFGFDKLIRWIEISKESGIEYYEFSHFFTQWGSEHCPKIMAEKNGEYVRIFGWETDSLSEDYVSFLRALAPEMKKVLAQTDIEKYSIFHVSDEPGSSHLETYKGCSSVVKELFGEYKIIDALSDYEFYSRGIVRTPVASINHAAEFAGRCDDLWIYYCCGPVNGNYPNRFLALPSPRIRALGLVMYKYDVKGFLQWGFNYWYSCLSRYKINPYHTADADKIFTAGDPFVVYPGEDLKPVCSLRLKVFDDGFNDMRALKLLEKLAGREKAEEILNSECEISFNTYPEDEKSYFMLRDRINREIDRASFGK